MKPYNNGAIRSKDSYFFERFKGKKNGDEIYCIKVTEFIF